MDNDELNLDELESVTNVNYLTPEEIDKIYRQFGSDRKAAEATIRAVNEKLAQGDIYNNYSNENNKKM